MNYYLESAWYKLYKILLNKTNVFNMQISLRNSRLNRVKQASPLAWIAFNSPVYTTGL